MGWQRDTEQERVKKKLLCKKIKKILLGGKWANKTKKENMQRQTENMERAKKQ